MMVSDVAKTLESKKLLTRRPHSLDGRAMALRLTPRGARDLSEAMPVVESIDDNFFGRLGAADLRRFKELLIRLVSE
jgi:DNA-binding MarR family transcriptional regulator